MGLISAWSRAATSRPHVLIAEAPGAFGLRVALERAVHSAGWCLTDTVADADVLAVVGEPGTGLMEAFARTWEQMSEPRVRVEVSCESDIAPALVEARETLRDTTRQLAQADRRSRARPVPDHHGDHMAPDGIPLAEGADDRDGLEMDVLHLPLGPVLAHWPAGVVLRLSLHGDVVADAEVEFLAARTVPAPDEYGPLRAARLLDAASSVLVLAGLPSLAARAGRLRDRSVDGPPVDPDDTDDLARRVRRHRTLRWLLDGLVLVREDGQVDTLHDRLVGLVERAGDVADGGVGSADPAGPALEAVPALLRGQELSAVRLWMAVLGADLSQTAPERAAHG